MIPSWLIDLEDKFNAKVRESKMVTRSSRSREGEISVSNMQVILELKFDLEVLDRLHNPAFVIIERKTSNSIKYLVYEVTAPKPIHYQMLGMDVSMPTVLRKEYLGIINDSWEESNETWIDIVTVPTNYELIIDDNIRFERTNLIPLIGASAYLLSSKAVEKFLCIDDGIAIGDLIGFNIPLKVDISNMIRYHTGIFGFTGVGKSNLTSSLLRNAIKTVPDLHTIIFDISGEYIIHLLDMLDKAVICSTERFEDPDTLLTSQTIPETLEDKLGYDTFKRKIQAFFDHSTPYEINLANSLDINIQSILDMLKHELAEKSSIQAKLALQEFNQLISNGIDARKDLRELSDDEKQDIISLLERFYKSLHIKSGLRNQLDVLFEYINSKPREQANDNLITPEGIARMINFNAPRLTIAYIPEPDQAREVVSRFINSLLMLRKRSNARDKVLVILDEAQEFIPDRRSIKDYSEQSNLAVEGLLRQGRKYRVHCWLSTQRLAHLNVNALQQLHSYFISTMPRSYDRFVIADAFSLSYDILDKTTELSTGEWLFVSYKATKQKNVPAFIKAYNNEEILLNSI
ncbi:MAG: ATPase [Candidatus Nitrosocaldaceae archaeon]|nr:MAG: ATPase [Candidatus Nitrosocaldaceae archaeon]